MDIFLDVYFTLAVMKMRALPIVVLVMVIVVGALWGRDILLDCTYCITIVESAPLYSLPPHEYPKTNPVLATLTPGTPVQVLRLRYGKDFQMFRVQTSTGLVGWVIGGSSIKVVSHG